MPPPRAMPTMLSSVGDLMSDETAIGLESSVLMCGNITCWPVALSLVTSFAVVVRRSLTCCVLEETLVPQHPVSQMARLSKSIRETYNLCIMSDLFLTDGNIVGLKQLLWIGGDIGVLAIRTPSLSNVSIEVTNWLSVDIIMSTDDLSLSRAWPGLTLVGVEGSCKSWSGLPPLWGRRSADRLLSRYVGRDWSRLGP